MSYFCFENIRVVDMTDTRTINDRIINVVWKGLMGLMRMEKYSSRALLLLTAGLILAGCSRINDGKEHRRHVIAELMDSAEVIMNDEPELAFRFMDSIDSHSISGRERIARYALLYSEAQYKNGIDAADDSLIMIAVRYYSINKNMLNRFRSYYMLGCTYNGLGQLIDAAVALGQAEQLADKIDDGFRLGLLYTQLGNVFLHSFDFRRAEHYYRMAMEKYAENGRETHRIYALCDIGGCLIQLNEYDSAYVVMTEVQKWAEKNNDIRLVSSCLMNRLSCSLNLGNLNNADLEINQYIEMFGIPKKGAHNIGKIAHYYIQKNDYAKAKELINAAWTVSNPSDSITLLYIESLLQEQTGNMGAAIDLYKQSIDLQNNNLRSLLDQPVLGAQNDYLKTLAEKEALKAKHNRAVVLFMSILIVLIITIFFIANRIHKVNNEKEKQDYLLTIKELRLKEDTNNEIINQLNKKVNTLFSKQYAELDRIFDKMMEIEENQELASIIRKNKINNKEKDNNIEKADILYSHIKKQLEEFGLKKNQKKIDSIIDATLNNLMTRIKDSRFKMADEEIRIIRFSLIGFSVKTINKITGLTPKYIYQRRDRAIQKIGRISPEIQQELYNMLK